MPSATFLRIFLLTRRAHFEGLGRFDPVYAPAYYD